MAKENLTHKQEGFCRSFVETGNATEAYRRNYSHVNCKRATINRSAKTLIDKPKIMARIHALQAIHQARHEVTVDSLTNELEEDRQLARDLGQPAAAVSALNIKARIHGLDRQVHNVEHQGLPAAINVLIVDNH